MDLSDNGSDEEPLTNSSDSEYYKNANKLKKDKKPHKCPNIGCSAAFSRPYRLKNHILNHHEGEKAAKCSYEDCDKSYSSQTHLKRHENRVHNEKEDDGENEEILCPIEDCGMILKHRYNLKRHLLRAHEDLPFQCKECSESFRRKNQLNAHKTLVHNAEVPYQCLKCNKAFVELHLFNKHTSRHKDYKCDCNEIFGKWTEYLKHKKISCKIAKIEHKCVICQKIFTLKQNLTQHCLKVHVKDSQKEEFKCPYLNCNRSYQYKKNLTFHIRVFHEKIAAAATDNNERFPCNIKNCEVTLKTKKNLKNHLRLCHNAEKLKVKMRRKPRKDKGIKKKGTAAELSGLKMTDLENLNDVQIPVKKLINNNNNKPSTTNNSDLVVTLNIQNFDETKTRNNNTDTIIFDFPELEENV